MKHEILIYNKTHCKISKKFISDTVSEILEFVKLKQPVELAVLVVSAEEIRELNKIWRHKNYTPDELSFGLNSRQNEIFAKKQNKVLELGQIVINVACLPVGKDKIFDKNKFFKILVHSLLHLLGFNHEKSRVKAEKMDRLERKILKYLNI